MFCYISGFSQVSGTKIKDVPTSTGVNDSTHIIGEQKIGSSFGLAEKIPLSQIKSFIVSTGSISLTQLNDSLAWYVSKRDSLIKYVTPKQIKDSLNSLLAGYGLNYNIRTFKFDTGVVLPYALGTLSAGYGLNYSGRTFKFDSATSFASYSLSLSGGFGIVWASGSRNIRIDTSTLLTYSFGTSGVGYGLNFSGRTYKADSSILFSDFYNTLVNGVGYGINIPVTNRNFSLDTINVFPKLASTFSSGYGLNYSGRTYKADSSVLATYILGTLSAGTGISISGRTISNTGSSTTLQSTVYTGNTTDYFNGIRVLNHITDPQTTTDGWVFYAGKNNVSKDSSGRVNIRDTVVTATGLYNNSINFTTANGLAFMHLNSGPSNTGANIHNGIQLFANYNSNFAYMQVRTKTSTSYSQWDSNSVWRFFGGFSTNMIFDNPTQNNIIHVPNHSFTQDQISTSTTTALSKYLLSNGTTVTSSTTVPTSDLTGILLTANGGRNRGNPTLYDIEYASSTSAFSGLAIGTANQVLAVNASANGYQWNTVSSGTTYTFSTGLTNTSSTITSNISTGISGGQTIIGGTSSGEQLIIEGSSTSNTGNTSTPVIIVGNNVLNGSNTSQVSALITTTLNQTSSAGSELLKLKRYETALGSGSQYFITAYGGSSGTTSLFSLDNSGNIIANRTLCGGMLYGTTGIDGGAAINYGGTNSNFAVFASSFGTTQTAAQFLMGTGTSTANRSLFYGSSATNPSANFDACNVAFGKAAINANASGTHNLFCNVGIQAPTINTSTSTITNAAALFIKDAPSGATNNYSLMIGSGDAYFGGNHIQASGKTMDLHSTTSSSDCIGSVTLSSGTATVSTTCPLTGDFVFISGTNPSGTLGTYFATSIVNATSVTISSYITVGGVATLNTLDGSTLNYIIYHHH